MKPVVIAIIVVGFASFLSLGIAVCSEGWFVWDGEMEIPKKFSNEFEKNVNETKMADLHVRVTTGLWGTTVCLFHNQSLNKLDHTSCAQFNENLDKIYYDKIHHKYEALLQVVAVLSTASVLLAWVAGFVLSIQQHTRRNINHVVPAIAGNVIAIVGCLLTIGLRLPDNAAVARQLARGRELCPWSVLCMGLGAVLAGVTVVLLTYVRCQKQRQGPGKWVSLTEDTGPDF